MNYSYVTLPGDGTTTTFAFSFGYIDKSHVTVKVGNVSKSFTWLNDQTLTITPAPTGIVEIRRNTPKDAPPVNFTDGSVLEEAQLDLLATFTLYCVQEAADAAAGGLQGFQGTYYGASATAPLTDPLGNLRTIGDLYLDISDATASTMRVWDGTLWRSVTTVGSVKRDSTVASAGQTVLLTPTYSVGSNNLFVYINGAKIPKEDYEETSQNSVTFSAALTGGEEIEVIIFDTPISGSIDSLAVNFTGPSGIQRNTQGKLQEKISVFDFMTAAQVNNVTARLLTVDVTVPIQNALNYLAAAGGGRLEFPVGSYRISSALLYDASDIQVVASPGAIIWPYGSDGVKFGNLSSTTYTSGRRNNITIENLTVNMLNAPGFRAYSIYATDELKMTNCSAFRGLKGIHLIYTYNATIFNCVSILSSSVALELEAACDKTTVIRGQYGNSGGYGILLRGGKGITIMGASIERNQLEAILGVTGLRETAVEWGDAYNIQGNYIERNCQSGGIAVIALGAGADTGDYSKGHVISGNYLNWDAGNPSSNATTPFLSLGKVSETTVTTNRYVNGSNYIRLESTAFKNRIFLNDISGEQAGINQVRCEVPLQIVPISNTLTTDSAGNGAYEVTLGNGFSNSWIASTIANGPTNAITSYTQINPNRYSVKVKGATANSTIGFNCLIVGKIN